MKWQRIYSQNGKIGFETGYVSGGATYTGITNKITKKI